MGAGLGAAAGPIGSLISGGIGILGSMRGSKERQAEARKARADFETRRGNLQNFTFTNPFAGMENVAEDLTINQEAAQFQAQQLNNDFRELPNVDISLGLTVEQGPREFIVIPTSDMIKIKNYNPHPPIKAKLNT